MSALTPAEVECVEMLGRAYTLFSQIVADGPTRETDLADACIHIHALQHAVMAQAAGRAHPELFRLLGESLS